VCGFLRSVRLPEEKEGVKENKKQLLPERAAAFFVLVSSDVEDNPQFYWGQ
jgi:hypothetical protein